MKKWSIFIIFMFIFSISVSFAQTCDEYCRNHGGLGSCAGLFSGCPKGYVDSGGSYDCGLWVFSTKIFSTKCCCEPVLSAYHSPSEVTDETKVTYTAELLVDLPIVGNGLTIKADNDVNSCTSKKCSLVGGPYEAGTTHYYYAIVQPVGGSVIRTEKKTFTVKPSKTCDPNKWGECIVDCTNKCGIVKGKQKNECGEERECSKDCGVCPAGYSCMNNLCQKTEKSCVRYNPDVTVNPSSITTSAGSEVEYEITVKNNHQNCEDADFELKVQCPLGWKCSFDYPSLRISSGSSAESVLKIKSNENEVPGFYRIRISASNLNYVKYVYTDYIIESKQLPSCSGSISLNLPASVQPGSKVTASVSGLSNCDGKVVGIFGPTAIFSPTSLPLTLLFPIRLLEAVFSTPITLLCSCTVSGSGCSCEITAPNIEGDIPIFVAVDKDDDHSPDPGETTSATLKVAKQLPSCSGSISLNLPASVQPGSKVTASVSGLSNCYEKTAYVVSRETQQSVCSCTVSGSGCSCEITAPNVEGKYSYYAMVDINGNGNYEDPGDISGVKSFTVQVAKDNPPLIAITKPIGKTTLPITLKFMVYDKESGVDKGSLAYRLDSGSWISIPSSSCTGSCEKVWPYSCTCEVPIEAKLGQHTLEVRAKDTAGNEGTGSTIFTVEYPSCSGSVYLSLPASVQPGSKVTASVSGLSNCYEKTAYVVSRETQQSVCSCTVSGSGCSCEITAPNVEGKYSYYAMVDINGNGNYEDPGDISSDVTLTTTLPFTCKGSLVIECSANKPIKATLHITDCANYRWNVRVSAPTILGLPLLDYCEGDITTQDYTTSCQTTYPASQYPEGNQLTTYKLYVYPIGTPVEKISQVWREIASQTIKCVSVETTTSTTTTTTTKPPSTTTTTTTTIPSCDENTCYSNCLARGNIDGYCSSNQCICVPKTGGPIPAGILGSLWDFIKSLLGIQ